ncbi:hypothetical protein BS50DRAFT_588756 [Corynespora cassiicola Philippines]|uniref:N-acetyltransferase domain-containing protein n=1 Tax=Corynespora cassiicola Philippines TaxID=1448308 RepID=A0A2T2NL18_CORCC|nr:hypothetical protein BS50DRAFT_588756 [Corynespora cassiicola Philippines]
MPLKLLSAEYSDMRELMEVMYPACSDPRDPFVDLCMPGLGEWSTSTQGEGIDELAKNSLGEWKLSETKVWVKVVDEESDKIVRYVFTEIHEKNPFEDGSRLREYAEWLINWRYGQAAERCQCPHVSHRQGAASLALQWGVDKADAINAKAFIEATVDGARLYERFGFVTKQIVN